MSIPCCYFYDNPYSAYKQAEELITAGFEAATMYWEGSGRWMVSFEIR